MNGYQNCLLGAEQWKEYLVHVLFRMNCVLERSYSVCSLCTIHKFWNHIVEACVLVFDCVNFCIFCCVNLPPHLNAWHFDSFFPFPHD